MKIITGKQGSGKTDQLIRLADNFNGYIVVMSHRRAVDVRERAIEIGCKVNFPISFEEFLQHRYHGRNCSPLWIDDADELIRWLCPTVGIGGITVTMEDDPT